MDLSLLPSAGLELALVQSFLVIAPHPCFGMGMVTCLFCRDGEILGFSRTDLKESGDFRSRTECILHYEMTVNLRGPVVECLSEYEMSPLPLVCSSIYI